MTTALLATGWTFVTLLLLGGFLESGFRLWFKRHAHIYIWPPHFHVEMDMDRKILPNLTPHARFQANSLGVRGDEPPPRGANAFRILACGGSGVECFALDQMENWPSLVGAYLGRSENRALLGVDQVYVANLGKSGFTPDALCYLFPDVLPRFGPIDVVTIMLAASAVAYWMRVGTPSELPPPDAAWLDIACHSNHEWGWNPKGTALAEVARRLRHRVRRKVEVRTGAGAHLAKARAMRSNGRELRDTYGDPTRWLEQYETSLTHAVVIAREYAQRVVLIRQPWFDKPNPTPGEAAMFWHGSVGDPYVGFCDTFYTHRVICALMELIDGATVRVGERTGADVLPPHIDASVMNSYDHFHVTTHGSRLMGDYIGPHLLELEMRSRRGSGASQDVRVRTSPENW